MKRLTQSRWFELILLALISGLTYLPRIGEMGYYRDDWYFLYDALVSGSRALIEIPLHTRPIRGPLYALYFSWFGFNPFPYHVVMYLTRLLGGVGAWWLFHLVWEKKRSANFFMAVLSHHGLAAQAVTEEQIIAGFWRQVVWRAPSIRAGTTLVAYYPGVNYAEGNDVVWGPANFIYYPNWQGRMPVDVPLPASRLEQDSILQIINGNKSFEQTDLVIKFVHTETNYKNQLILTQPSPAACVHVLDPRWPDLSVNDPPFVHAAYRNSKVENIVTDADFPAVPVYGFGAELPREWCFYYQKADLARQQGDWEDVARLGAEAQQRNLTPNDLVEWMPFLQAYAFLGNQKQVKSISTRINEEPFYRQLACRNLNAMPDQGFHLDPEMQRYVDELFCQ
jgi:hypothetical protein